MIRIYNKINKTWVNSKISDIDFLLKDTGIKRTGKFKIKRI